MRIHTADSFNVPYCFYVQDPMKQKKKSTLNSYAALTPRRISLLIWKFEIRGKIAENDMIGQEKYWKK